MDTFLVCGTTASEFCLDGRLEVMYVDGAARNDGGVLDDKIGQLVDEALAARAMRKDEDAGCDMSLFQCGPPPNDDRVGVGKNDMKGLVGEIVAEAVLAECGFGEPFYSKWRYAGTSASKGIDIVMRKGDLLSVNESKHLHTLRPERGGAASGVSDAIAAAFRQTSDRHTREWLLWLRRRCVEAARLGGAVCAVAALGAVDMLRMAEIIKNALSDRSVSTSAVVVLDSRHEAAAESIRKRLGRACCGGWPTPQLPSCPESKAWTRPPFGC